MTDRNTSVSNLCKRCNKTVTTGHKCIKCGVISHKSCLKNVKAKFFEDSTVDCCFSMPEPNLPSNVSTAAQSLMYIKIEYFEELIKQKDIIIETQKNAISNQQITIVAQQELICHLKHSLSNSLPNEIKNTANSEVQNDLNNMVNSNRNLTKHTNVNHSSNNSNISGTMVSNAVHQAEAKLYCDKLINLANEDSIEDIKATKKIRKSTLIVGNSINSTVCPFKAASNQEDKYHYYHATNFGLDTKADGLQDYLRGYAKSCIVETLLSRHPQKYKSFKITLRKEEAQSILNEDIWPKGVIINRFFRSKILTK